VTFDNCWISAKDRKKHSEKASTDKPKQKIIGTKLKEKAAKEKAPAPGALEEKVQALTWRNTCQQS
jgi:hypothetical protein